MDLTGKTVLVTGAAGTLGSALVRQILQSPVNSVRALDRDESGLFWMERACEGPKPRILLGDVRDRHRVEEACRGVDLVFHAAAHKHVPYCEYNAEEAASVNVMGTAVTVSAAAGAGVKQFVLLSTDKAAEPVSALGYTKRNAENLVLSRHLFGTMSVRVVRLGNVLGSRGSVVPVMMDELNEKRSVTVTDPTMTRFSISKAYAVDCILRSLLCPADGTFVPVMSAYLLGDLANAVSIAWRGRAGLPAAKVEQKKVGARPGEQMHESLLSPREILRAKKWAEFYVVPVVEENDALKAVDFVPTSDKAMRIETQTLVRTIEAWLDARDKEVERIVG